MTNQTQNQGAENRYQLVNTVAKKAKVMLTHDTAAQISNHNAINSAIKQQKEEPQPPVANA